MLRTALWIVLVLVVVVVSFAGEAKEALEWAILTFVFVVAYPIHRRLRAVEQAVFGAPSAATAATDGP